MVTIIHLKSFLNDFKALQKRYRSLKSDVDKIALALKSNPEMGIPLGKDCYKIRMAIAL